MKSRLFQMSRPLVVLGCALFLGSCGEDPELVRKRDEQRAEITKLDGELSLLRERLGNLPPDQTKDLEKLKAESAANVEEIARLEAEVEGLEDEKAKLEKDFAAYQRKYAVR
ncbi:hypothetical protein OKA04_06215 [Luteolibacter flavescens]|uniref:Uncharacterized protein n=1 Tax=Luteolibacter flavescens TaxID=1859460 RepID=A0ABT3FL56_9BACT|nr:hypothetical protein [Luteolibacter flavescens]MCW1884318.1 hypothetical protein [Luteolibacter flavescens]